MRHELTSAWRLSAVVALALGGTLMLSGCESTPDPQATDAQGGGSASTPDDPAADPDASAPAGDDADADAASPPPAEPLTGAACLPGNWFVDNEHFGELMSSVSGSAVDNIHGVTMVTFRDDGTTTTHYDEWTHTITMDGATVTIVKDGSDSGTYEVAADGSMTLTDADLNTITTSEMEMGGQVIRTEVPPQPSVFSQATFTCEGDVLTVSAEGATTLLHREH